MEDINQSNLMNLDNLKRKVAHYREVLANTTDYRCQWRDGVRDEIVEKLKTIVAQLDIDADIVVKNQLENMEAIVMEMGEVKSGIYQKLKNDAKRHIIKYKGALIYQQMFNGKILVLLQLPYIEDFSQEQPPRTLGIYRPEEINDGVHMRHFDSLLTELTKWEDYDDEEPSKRIGFNLNYTNSLEEQ
jgi:hypothetical protein